ncbi:SDR family NAD(P)-dependent oxidoreductase [Yinghuangia soli]|uniref:SDR family NAD(P)-dependent oxidoreductase n=1 Tax=Yinghuangia soli TaxID=2908204 RepID=A0AA41TZP6_9ACTN|nr:SDR family NAD(P)-dependent oxidoreductase [Yinghuangia soli]MCF2527731.1 SDR family NAD(P)-dependent oxidoreductase [Yinghuangia soli]
MRELTGRVGVVTGAARGIGRGTAEAMAAAGMRVVLADLDADRLAATVADLQAEGAEAIGIPTDVTDPAAVQALADAAVAAYGTVHVAVNNAGICTLGLSWQTELDDWQRVFDVNLYGVVHGVRAFMPILLANPDGGHIANVASMGGMLIGPMIAPYTASKAAVIALSKSLRAETALSGADVGVTVVCPGNITTEMADHLITAGELPPQGVAMRQALQKGNANGIPAREAGGIILDAVRDNRFWALPNGAAQFPLVEQSHEELRASFGSD